MSMTESVGCMPLRHYSYTAGQLKEWLIHIAKRKKIEGDEISRPLYIDAEAFFRRIVDVQKEIPDNPPAAISGFIMVAEIIRPMLTVRGIVLPDKIKDDHALINSRINEYYEFFGKLGIRRSLSDEEVAMAKEFSDFMRRLEAAGNSDAYNSHMLESHKHHDGLSGLRRYMRFQKN
ncbi:MAG TPA: hypothetical protein VJH55_02635 [Candidatus Paceibacterota bacterium]